MKIANSKNGGFTLIELIVVFAIIAILSGVVLQSLNSTRSKSRDAVRLQNIESIAKSFQVATTGANANQFPTSNNAYTCLGKATAETCWTTPFNGLNSVNTTLLQGLSGVIPFDPLYTIGQDGGAYLYHSNFTPTNPAGLPTGAYLSWKMESLNSCGRGYTSAPNLCILYLGPPTP